MTHVALAGRPGGTTHRAVEVVADLPAELRLIGGLAVLCRVGTPHRATVDLDAVARHLDDHHLQLSRLAVTSVGGGQYRFAGDLELDVIEVAPQPAAELVEQLGGDRPLSDLELNAVALTWAHDGATPVDLEVLSEDDRTPLAVARQRLVATHAGLVATKCSAVPLRASSRPEKRASDLYDLARLLVTAGEQLTELDHAPNPIRTAVAERLVAWFVDPMGRDRTYRETRRFDDPAVDLDHAADVVDELAG